MLHYEILIMLKVLTTTSSPPSKSPIELKSDKTEAHCQECTLH